MTEGSKVYVIPRKEELKQDGEWRFVSRMSTSKESFADVPEGQDSVLLRLESIAKEKVKPLSAKVTDLLMDVERGANEVMIARDVLQLISFRKTALQRMHSIKRGCN